MGASLFERLEPDAPRYRPGSADEQARQRVDALVTHPVVDAFIEHIGLMVQPATAADKAFIDTEHVIQPESGAEHLIQKWKNRLQINQRPPIVAPVKIDVVQTVAGEVF